MTPCAIRNAHSVTRDHRPFCVTFATYEHTTTDTTVAIHAIRHGKEKEMHVHLTESLKIHTVMRYVSIVAIRPAMLSLRNMAMNIFVDLAKI